MKTYYQASLLGEIEILLSHAALDPAIIAVGADRDGAEKELQRQLVLRSKNIAHRYLALAKKSRGNHLKPELEKSFEYCCERLRKVRRNSKLEKVQEQLHLLLPDAKKLMSHPKSRFYRSQCAKLDFLTQAADLEIGSDKSQENVYV
jgi:flagellin-specific chaperone FliS